MPESITVQVSRTVADYDAFRRQASRTVTSRPAYRVVFYATVVAAGVVALALQALTRTSPGWSLSSSQVLVLFVTFFGAWSLINWLVAPLLQSRFYPRLDVFGAPLTILLDDSGVRLESAVMSQTLRWAAISGVSTTVTHFYLQIDGMPAIVIPRRAFANPARQDEFLRAVRAHQSQSPP